MADSRIGDLLNQDDNRALWELIWKATPEAPVFHFEHVVSLLDGTDMWIHWQGKSTSTRKENWWRSKLLA